MPISAYDNGQWRTVVDPQVYDNGAWRQVQTGHVYDNGAWRQVFTRAEDPEPTPPPPEPSPTSFDEKFFVDTKQVHWNSGSQDNQSSTSPLFIQGSFDGTSTNRRFTLVFFDDAAIRNFLSGASISEIYFGTTREGGTHGQATANISIGTTFAGSPLSSWTGTGVTARGSASVGRGSFVEVGLANATGSDFQSGAAKSIAVGSENTGLALSEYGRYEASGSYIRFVGTK